MTTRFDPISLEIMWSRLINVTEECWVTIWRTAFSTIIGEAQDFGCELLDAHGNSMAHSPRSMPTFNLTLPRAVKEILRIVPPGSLADGDVLITNDPWICAGHLFDIAVVTPVFRQGRLVGLVGSIAHCSDIGGIKDSGRAREVYDEGLQIPPLWLYRGGRLNEDLAEIIRRNVRRADMVFGDIQAQVASNHVGAQRLLAFMDEYGFDDLEPLALEVQTRAEVAMRRAIAAVPDGTYRSEIAINVAGRHLRLPCAVIVEGDELTVDWEGAPSELPIGGFNCTYSYASAHTTYALKSILTPDIPSNAGCFRPLHVRAPEGSIFNCRHPAAVNQRTMTGWFCGPAIFRALAPVLPAKVQAFTGLPATCSAYGQTADGQTYNDHIMFGGGQGGSAQGDGYSALMYPTSAGNVPVEMFEQRTPLVVECKELTSGTGGAGAHRGGLAQRMVLRKLYHDGLPVLLNFLAHGHESPVPGLLGGRSGKGAGYKVVGGTVEAGNGTSTLVELRGAGDSLALWTAGGSGFGEAARRDPSLIARDRAGGYVTAGARRSDGRNHAPGQRRRTGPAAAGTRTARRGRTSVGVRGRDRRRRGTSTDRRPR
jgi:5-oxoprolinase (ATP-hydrolysing)/N-methylhydantoinase A